MAAGLLPGAGSVIWLIYWRPLLAGEVVLSPEPVARSNAFRRILEHPWGPIGLTLAVALSLRVTVALWLPARVVWGDGERYLLVATNLLAGHGFGSILENRLSVPTQPLLIAALFLVFGKSFVVLRLFFACLGAATCALGYVLARQLFDRTTALVAGLLLAVYPPLVYLSALFEFPQVLFIFLMAVSFICLFKFLQTNRKWELFISGLFIGFAILTAPSVLLFVPLLALCLWSRNLQAILVRWLVLGLAIAIPVGAWAARNHVAYGQVILVNQAAGMNFATANNETYYRYGKEAVVPACAPGYEATPWCRDYKTRGVQLGGQFSKGEIDEKQLVAIEEKNGWDDGLAFMRESPSRFALLAVRKFFQFWSPNPDAVHSGGAYGGKWRDLLAIASYVPLLSLGLAGFVLTADRWRRMAPIYAYFLAFSAAYSIYLPTMRYRLPLDFFLVIFCAYALQALARRFFGITFAYSSSPAPHESPR